MERKEEKAEVKSLVRESFWNVYSQGCTEHYVLHCMRDDHDFVPERCFVMLKDGVLSGRNIFVRAHIITDDGTQLPIMTMGPICNKAFPDKEKLKLESQIF